ncbi:hypothetical protein OEZ86_009203 [Tetradesmus obliquus]|nr:hypothetical protein OEZ86_009203 [Tetradesmus obliquus]
MATAAVPPSRLQGSGGDDERNESVPGTLTVGGGVAAAISAQPLFRYWWDLLWTKSVYAIKAARQLQPGQVVSAIAGLNCLTMKKRMVQTLRMALGAKAFSIVPLSFCIPEDLAAWQAWLGSAGPGADTGMWMLKTGQDAGKGLRLVRTQHAGPGADTGMWMLKTGQDAGKGLRLVRTQHALQVALRPPKNPSKPQTHIKVAQQYITNPLLIRNRKFHLRLWLLVTSHSPLRAYLHSQGLVLFSSEAYDKTQPVDGPGVRPSVGHVTNYARNEDTWVWGLDELAAELGQQQWQQLWAAMRRSSALTAASVLGPMRAAHRWLQPSVSNYGFQMLGLDYLVDEAMQPWLLEVNSAPSVMAVHSEPDTCRLIKDTKQAMLHDMLTMVQHRMGEAPARQQQQQQRQRQMSWQQELAAEMANRGGFEPLMELFPVGQQQQQQQAGAASSSSGSSGNSIPWQEVDVQLQRLLAQQQQQQQQ